MKGGKDFPQLDPHEWQVRILRVRHGLSEPQARLHARLIFGERVR